MGIGAMATGFAAADDLDAALESKDYALAERILEQLALDWKQELADGNPAETAREYGLEGFGRALLIDPEGKVVPGGIEALKDVLGRK